MFKLNQYNTLFISEYKGKKSLCMGYVGTDGNPYPHKIQQKFGKNSDWKDAWFKIPFEDDAQAIEALRAMLMELGDKPIADDSHVMSGEPPF